MPSNLQSSWVSAAGADSGIISVIVGHQWSAGEPQTMDPLPSWPAGAPVMRLFWDCPGLCLWMGFRSCWGPFHGDLRNKGAASIILGETGFHLGCCADMAIGSVSSTAAGDFASVKFYFHTAQRSHSHHQNRRGSSFISIRTMM